MSLYTEISEIYEIIKAEIQNTECTQNSVDEHQQVCRIMMDRYGDIIIIAADKMYRNLNDLDENSNDYNDRLSEWANVDRWIHGK